MTQPAEPIPIQKAADLPAIKVFVSETKSEAARKVLWVPEDDNWPSYVIDIDLVNRKAAEARKALTSFVKQCMNQQAGGVARSGKQLKELAERGRDLYEAIFLDKNGGPAIPRLQTWVRGLAGTHRINVVVEDRTHVPWGLVYDGDPSKLTGAPEDVDISLFGDFWCLKYLVSALYNRMSLKGLGGSKSVDLYHLLSAIHQEVFAAAEQSLEEPERKVLDWLRAQFTGTRAFKIFSKRDLLSQWSESRNDVDMLFFYCHADGTSIAFSNTDKLTMDDITLKLRREAAGEPLSPCLVFLNGCSTASGDPTGGFLEATGGEGFCGFIGTEAEVPDLFALRFGLAFLYHFLLEDAPVYLIMDRLRREHWPLSLVYSTYCYPMLRVTKPADFKGVEVKGFNNFSQAKQLGTKLI